ncbi:MAG: hypothetical protein H6R06_2031 [Proteobacteria bacterium]|nr:hypothetical protein [Pseudomonadota bacterium]
MPNRTTAPTPRTPATRPTKAPEAAGKVAPSGGSESSPKDAESLLPHDREQSKQTVAPTPNAVVRQAKDDVDAGMVDTDMRVTPDAQRRTKVSPGADCKPTRNAG